MLGILLALAVILLVAFALGFYVFLTLGLTALSLGWLFSDRPIWQILGHIPWNLATNTTLLALPLYVLMGEILLRSGITEGMYQALSKWLNRLPGTLLHTNIVASGMFACISGSSAATAATVGGVALPFLRAARYDDRIALGSLAAGGTLGILLPPSIVMIVYGVLAEESIGRLYLAGVVPGVLLMLGFMATIVVITLRHPDTTPPAGPTSWPDRWRGLVHLVPIAILVVLVLGTIYAGIATATEAAAFGVTGAIALAAAKGRVTARMLSETFLATATTTAMIVMILIGAFLLQFIVSFLGLPSALSRWVVSLELSSLQVILIICALYIVLGMFMESLSIVVVTVPILVPMLQPLGVDLIWFGVIIVVLVELALITPPVGMNLFILQGISSTSKAQGGGTIKEVYVGVLPFLVALLAILLLVVLVPDVALWLPNSAFAR
jgi:C4-dicarboxylate transporter, DctM subunit